MSGEPSGATNSSTINEPTMLACRLYGAVEGSIRSFTRDELDKKVKLERVPIPKPRYGEVLIKVAMSCILPMNMSELKATYGTWNKDSLQKAVTCGSEGCGTVVESGGGIFAWRLVGKRVAFFGYNRAWAEYAVVSAYQTMDIGQIPFEKAVNAFSNPMTALAFIEIAQAAGCKTIVHTAAASVLGLMLIRHAKRVGVNVIAVCRKKEQLDACSAAGALEVVDSTSENFHATLTELCKKHNATIGFDAVAGAMTGDVMNALPNGGKVYVYGGLSEQHPSVSTRDLIFKRKSLEGFWLKDYVATKYSFAMLQWTWTIVTYLETDFASKHQGFFPLSKVHDAILQYSKEMSRGKCIIVVDSTLEQNKV